MHELRTRIRIGAHETRIETWPSEGGAREWMLDIGTHAMGGRAFPDTLPSALDIENAIEQVENAVMPLMRQLPPATQLVTDDAIARELQRLTNGWNAGETLLFIDDVELVFNQIAAVALGRPSASSDLPDVRGFAAYVLILREAMHHLGFNSIIVLPQHR